MNDDRTLLPEQIRNLPTRGPKGTIHTDDYLTGHRDARHAAAELAAAALSAAPAQEPVAWRGAMQQALNALEMAQAGLEWYRDAQPENVNGSDEEADEVIGDAMQSLRDALSASPLPQEVKALTDERIEEVLSEAYRKLVREQGYSGGMGGATWDLAAARAIERELRGAQEVKAGEDWQDIPDDLIAGILRFAWKREPTLREITSAAKAARPSVPMTALSASSKGEQR